MPTDLETITTLSHAFGADDYVMGGGGNTSCKDDETLWIKPSGTTLSGLTPERFIAMDRRRLATLFTLETPADATAREALVKEVMAGAVRAETPGRASVEAPVHECFRARFVVHTHPTRVNGLVCALGGRETARRLFPDSLWMGYVDPGYTLSQRVREALARHRETHGGREPRLMWLENHGVFVAGDTDGEIRGTYAEVMGALQAEYRVAGIAETVPSGAAPSAEWVAAATELLRTELGDEARVVLAAPAVNAAAGPISPDHLVYAKSFSYEGVLAAAALRAFAARRGYWPRVVAAPEGLLACGATPSVAARALEFAQDAARIRHLARA
ncbi:MAG: class II aldolase, partial [Lentisphaerae bacterium]|nr:class II aldolase [Lentisphaerota bacterium]